MAKKVGEAFHYEEQDLLIVGRDEPLKVNVKVPDEKPEIIWDGMEEMRASNADKAPITSAVDPGEGYHYEQRELKMVGGESRMVNVKVPDEKPEIDWGGMEEMRASNAEDEDEYDDDEEEYDDDEEEEEDDVEEEDEDDEEDEEEEDSGYHYEQRELKMVNGDSYMVNVKVPNERPKIKMAFSKDNKKSEDDSGDYGQEGSNNDGVQTGTFVAATATLQCPFGTMTSKLVVGPDRTTMLGGKPMANIMDYTPMYNIMPFGQCNNPGFPPTASATAAAMGTLTPMPCVPNIVAPWAPPKANLMVNGKPALMMSCMCNCLWGGVITIQNDGQ